MNEKPIEMVNMTVTCWNCRRSIGSVSVAKDLIAVPAEEGKALVDHMLVGMLNGLFTSLSTAKPSTLGLICPDCHKKLVDKQQGAALAGQADIHLVK